MNSPIRTSTIGLLQYLQLLYLPSELDIDEQIQQVILYFYCIQYQYYLVILTNMEQLISKPIKTKKRPVSENSQPEIARDSKLVCLY
jgi:hypothetical protein